MSSENFYSTRKYLWGYFQLHASQRLTTFNFYIVLSTLLSTGLFSTFQKDFTVPVGVILGFLLVCFSFVFWKLDERNKGLIKLAETALMDLEKQLSPEAGEALSIFTREALETGQLRANRSVWPWRNLYSYSDCFRLVFLLFASVGVIGGIFSAYRVFL